MLSAQKQLAQFIARFDPELAKRARAAIALQRQALPHAKVLVYDNFNALVVAFSRTEKSSAVVFSIALYAKWINLFFWNGALLDDPKGLLIGDGRQVRHVRLEDVALFENRDFSKLMTQALRRAGPFDETQKGEVIIKAIAKRQRPRRS